MEETERAEEIKFEMIPVGEMWRRLKQWSPQTLKALEAIKQLQEGKALIWPLTGGLSQEEEKSEVDRVAGFLYRTQLHRWNEKGHVHTRHDTEKHCLYVFCVENLRKKPKRLKK